MRRELLIPGMVAALLVACGLAVWLTDTSAHFKFAFNVGNLDPCAQLPGPTPTPVPTPVEPIQPQPQPQPQPPPQPPPAPTFADQVTTWAAMVNSPSRAMEAAAIATAIEALAAKLEGGTYRTSGYVLANFLQADISQAAIAGAGAHVTEWRAAMAPLGDATFAKVKSGELSTPEQWAPFLRLVAVGLRRVG